MATHMSNNVARVTAMAVGVAVLIGGGSAQAQRRGGPGMGGGPPDGTRLMEHLDTNDDGKLTEDEVPTRMWRRLSRGDQDDDGAIGADELQQMIERRRAQRRDRRPRRPQEEKDSDAEESGGADEAKESHRRWQERDRRGPDARHGKIHGQGRHPHGRRDGWGRAPRRARPGSRR